MSVIRLYFLKQLLRRFKNRADYKNIPLSRRAFERSVAKFNRPLAGFVYTPAEIEGIKCEWVQPQVCNTNAVLVYFHGGGYAAGSINTHRALVSQLAKNAGVKALSVEYSLAPESTYPAPIEDAAKVYQWLLANGYSAAHIAFGGDSAGGGVTLCTLAYLRDKQLPLPKCAIALSPWVDHTLSGESYLKNKDIDPMLVAEGFPLWSKNYLGEADARAPYASPVFYSLAGLPPIYIQVGEEEMLLDDSIRFAARAKEDGVDIKLEVYPKKFHVFNAFWRILPRAREANRKLGAFIKEQLNG